MGMGSRNSFLTMTLGLLSGLWGCEALLPDLLPVMRVDRRGLGTGSFAAEATLLAILCCWFGLHAAVKRVPRPTLWEAWKLVAAGVALFVLPATLIRLAGSEISAYARTVLLTLIPMFSVVLEPYLGRQGDAPLRGSLFAAMAGTVGALLVFPVDPPRSASATFSLALLLLAALLVAAAGCLLYRLGSSFGGVSRSLSPAMAVLAGTGAIGLIGAEVCFTLFGGIGNFWVRLEPEFGWIDLLELPALFLLLNLLPRMRPERSAVRYLLAPLITIVLGVSLLKLGGDSPSPLGLRTWLGLVVLAGSVGYLVLATESEADGDSRLLGLE